MKKLLLNVLALNLALGLVLSACGGGGSSEKKCSSDQDCVAGKEFCNMSTHTCEKICVPQCTGKCGGDNGCGGTCPNNCPVGQTCNTTTWACETCQPQCTGKCGGPDGCGGTCPNTCPAGQTCDPASNYAQCNSCQPQCTGKCGGPDGCGGTCPNTCPSGQTCQPPSYTQCSGACVEPGAECPNGNSDCPPEWPECLQGTGFTYCSKTCTTDADCGCNACCLQIQGGKACFDKTQCPGTGELGDPCPFDYDPNDPADGVNMDAPNCKENMACLGFPANSSSTACTQVSDCTDIADVFNPDCADNGHCGASFCALSCPNASANDGGCPAGSEKASVSGQCYCVPKEVGSSQQGDPCPFSNGVNETASACAAGLNCLGISGTSGQTCNNDGDCAGAFDSAWNPSCSNSGYCGASFCAGACPNPSAGDGGCPAGSCGYQITGLGCACVPNPVEKKCSDPVNNVGCNTGYMCVPAGGSGLSCETEGTCDFEQTCGTSVCECKAGHLCAGSGGSYSCMKLCDTEGDGSDCPAQYICGGITCVDKWGVCVKVPPCTITDGASACADAGDVCIPLHNCGSYGCFSSGGKNAGESCTYVNDCAAGLVCEGGQGQATCKPVCDPANPNCSSGTCQAPAGVCDPAPTTWGVCK